LPALQRPTDVAGAGVGEQTEIRDSAGTSDDGKWYACGVPEAIAIKERRGGIHDCDSLAALRGIAAIIDALPRARNNLRASAVGYGADDGHHDAVAGRAGRRRACVGPGRWVKGPGRAAFDGFVRRTK